ncbi:MAG TPA: hypothetical protein VNM90_28100 [Haliangium sp.]|nr:hypothetical protein [Haliangium sp.]
MTEYRDFTSLPPEKEQEFVVYERTSVEAGKKAKVIALAVAASFFVVVMGIVFSFEPPKSKMAEDDMGALAAPKKEKKEAAKKETPAAEAPKAEGAAAGEGTAAPAAGATADKPAGEGAAAPAAGATADKPAEGAKPEGQ